MTREIQLDIVWDGPIPSLKEHRVDLNAFAGPLGNLLAAARRIASNIVSDALEPAATGRSAIQAQLVDIELSGITAGPAGVATVLTFKSNSSQQPLFDELAENVGIALLDAMEAEARGNLKNMGVRKYLQSLPSTLTGQSYNLHENGRAIKQIKLGAIALPDTPVELPYLVEVNGRICGVGFDPLEIRFESDEAPVTVSATERHVEKALEYRNSEVRALVLKHGLKSKLLKLDAASSIRSRPDPEVHLFGKWHNLLQRLAQ